MVNLFTFLEAYVIHIVLQSGEHHRGKSLLSTIGILPVLQKLHHWIPCTGSFLTYPHCTLLHLEYQCIQNAMDFVEEIQVGQPTQK